MVLALVCIFKKTNSAGHWRGRPWGGDGPGRDHGEALQKTRCRVASCTQPSRAGCWLLPLRANRSRATSPAKAPNCPLFADEACFSSLGPGAGPEGLIPWTRFCKVGPVGLRSVPGSLRGPRVSPCGSRAGSLFWLISLPVGPQGKVFTFLGTQVSLQSESDRKRLPGDNILSHPKRVLFAHTAPLAAC